jgi:transcriptional regulator of acetoin/glycerol metabolism
LGEIEMSVLNPYFYALNPDILAYENAWVNYVKHRDRSDSVISNTVWESWERCREQGIDCLSDKKVELLYENDLIDKIAANRRASALINPFLQTIYEVVQGPGFMVTYSDKDAVILKCHCDDELLETAKRIRLVPGANMKEEKVGTNSIDLSIRTGKPVSVTGAEHYREIFHRLTSASVPIVDSYGELLGVLSVWGKQELTNPHMLGMITSSAKAIENELQIQTINEQLIENNSQLRAILKSVSDSIVYIRNNKITQINEEMLSLLGRKEPDVLNCNVDRVIITNPEIGKVLETGSNKESAKITLFANNKSYYCIVEKRSVFGSDKKEAGQMLIFKQVESITRLAKSVSMYVARYRFEDIIGKSEILKEAINIAMKSAEHDSRIIIEGESGTGKEMFAQAIHNAGARGHNPFVAIDCGAIPKELFETTLFGYLEGAFTGAKEGGRTGALELANKGTLFLDEIGNMPLDMQIKLLRVLQEGALMKVGGTKPIPIDVRVIAATNVSLNEIVEQGKFREDLYYRLNVVSIKTPPLRERREDIPLLVRHYLETTGVKNKKLIIETQATEMLQRYDWPGNIRQLFNAIERASIMTTGITIKVDDLPLEIIREADKTLDFGEVTPGNFYRDLEKDLSLSDVMKKYVLFSLKKNNHNISRTARALGITRATIYKTINAGS